MSKEKIMAGVYAPLDILLDTRWGTLCRINRKLAEKLLYNGYHERDQDVFAGFDTQEFKDLYAKRDVETLHYSMFTGAVEIIKQNLETIDTQVKTRPYYSGHKLTVNTYPYALTREMADELKLALRVKFDDVAPIEIISLSDEMLSPHYCDVNFGAMYMYNPEHWFNVQMRALEMHPLVRNILFTPAMFHREKPNRAMMEKARMETGLTPFTELQMLAAPQIDLQFIKTELVSITKSPA